MRTTIALLTLALAACATKAPPPPGDPLRPSGRALPAVVAVEENVPVTGRPLAQAPDDCEPLAPHEGPPPKPYKERSIEEGAALASQGLKILIESEDPTRAPEEVARKIEEATDRFFTALTADPYNPKATYNLSAAYARIGRNQCSLNLLARLVAMRNWSGSKAAIAGHLDRLFGRGKRWKGRPDPDFNALRRNDKFREITRSVQ